MQPHRSRTLREPTTVFTGACRRVVAVRPSWAWLREPAGRTGVAASASVDTFDSTLYIEARDAESTAAEMAPAVLRFFAANSRT